MDDYDVAVAGAGPAGSTAAYILSKKGYKVALLDKDRFPREKLCGGCLTAKTIRLLIQVFHEPEEKLTRQSIIDFKSNRLQLRFKTETLIDHPSASPFYFVERRTYDTFLLQKAKEAGAHVIEGEKVIRLEPDTEKSKLITSGNRLLRASFIIGADGANSILRTRFFPPAIVNSKGHRKWQHNLAYCLEFFLPRPREGYFQDLDYPIVSFGWLRYGYAWIFPNKERLVIGIGGLKRKNKNIAAAFNGFLSGFPGINTGSMKLRAHPMPYGNFMVKPVWGNLLLIGDAAGLADPLLGEGIYQAHKSGELAAQAIIQATADNTDPGAVYSYLLQTHLLPELIYARRWRWFLYHPLNHMFKFRSARALERHVHKLLKLVHGSRSYRWFRRTT